MVNTKMCPRTGRSPLRRKKSYLYMGMACLTLIGLLQVIEFNSGYMPLRPLPDAKSEAKRLLKFITHYHYQCNTTVQVGNRSHWPICAEKDIGLDLDAKGPKLAVTVGTQFDWDFGVERHLALNHSFNVFIVSHRSLPSVVQHTNHTSTLQATIVPNDPADFSRNSYGQQTINTLFQDMNFGRIDLLRLASMADNVNMWELVHYMTADNLFLSVNQLHLAVYIEKLDEDYIYSWFRALHDLFYKQGLRLYHTSSRDSLCLQVTLMESCMYFLSFVRDPGPQVFVLHPPADYGDLEMEEFRLLDYISTPQVECKQKIVGGPDDSSLHFTSMGQPQWQLCSHGVYQLFPSPCTVFRFRFNNDHGLEQKFIQEGCSVYTMEPIMSTAEAGGIKAYRLHSHQPFRGRKKSRMSEMRSAEEVLSVIQESGDISLVEIDAPGQEWHILGHLMDNNMFKNVSQLVLQAHLWSSTAAKHPTQLRSHYSQLRRLQSHGFSLFHSSPLKNLAVLRQQQWTQQNQAQTFTENCCYKLGFIKKKDPLR